MQRAENSKRVQRRKLLVTLPALAPLIAKHLDPATDIVIPPPKADLREWARTEGQGIRAAIIGGYEPFDEDLLASFHQLRCLAVFGEGMEGVDPAAAARRGVTISNAAGLHAPEVANHAVAMMLAARRRLHACDAWVREGRWLEARMPLTRAVAGTRVGIAGLGKIGAAIAERVEVFGCQVAWWGRSAKPGARWPRAASLIELAAASEVLFIAFRANDATRRLVGRAVLDALGPEGLLVNISRGFVIDEPELICALREGRLGQAALDVFDPEPTSPERWADVPNVLLSPHQGGATIETIDQLAAHAAASVREALASE